MLRLWRSIVTSMSNRSPGTTGRRNFALSMPARYGVLRENSPGSRIDRAAELRERFDHVDARQERIARKVPGEDLLVVA